MHDMNIVLLGIRPPPVSVYALPMMQLAATSLRRQDLQRA